MALIGKDISLLSQAASIVGTEKIPVSDTKFITPAQIVGTVPVDSALSSSSENAIQNKAVKSEFNKVAYLSNPSGEVSMNVPTTIEGITMNGSPVSVSGGVANLGTVITDISGKQDVIDSSHKLDYGLLSNTPTIPTVPTISTSISTDASSDDKTASPKAVKTYVDNIVGDIETLLAAI